MSCHFHLMRRRNAAMAKTDEKAAVIVQKEATKENVKSEAKPAQKAAKGRRKGDA